MVFLVDFVTCGVIITTPYNYQEEKYSTLELDHLGLIADKIADLNIIQLIDERLPMKSHAKVSNGERAAAMIINGLAFVGARLYLYPQFFSNKPVAQLFGKDLKAEDFNDDSLGRCLDAIARVLTKDRF